MGQGWKKSERDIINVLLSDKLVCVCDIFFQLLNGSIKEYLKDLMLSVDSSTKPLLSSIFIRQLKITLS